MTADGSPHEQALRKIALLDPQENGWKMYGEAQRIACEALDLPLPESDLLRAVRAFFVWLDGYPRPDTTVSSVEDAVAEIREVATQLRYLAGVQRDAEKSTNDCECGHTKLLHLHRESPACASCACEQYRSSGGAA